MQLDSPAGWFCNKIHGGRWGKREKRLDCMLSCVPHCESQACWGLRAGVNKGLLLDKVLRKILSSCVDMFIQWGGPTALHACSLWQRLR